MKEHLYPEKYDIITREPLPPPIEVLQLEKMRAKGCIVEYNEPNWVKEEKDKIKLIENNIRLNPFLDELKEISSKKPKKEILSKQYSFLKKEKNK